MANLFLYGPYLWLFHGELRPGAEHYWTFGPWPWYPSAVTITVHPAHWLGHEVALEVTSISTRLTDTGGSIGGFMDCTIRNIGRETVVYGYEIWIGGIRP